MEPKSKELQRLAVAIKPIGEWLEEQQRNSRMGKVVIDLSDLRHRLSPFVVALSYVNNDLDDSPASREFRRLRSEVGKIDVALKGFRDLYRDVDVFVAAKKKLIAAFEAAKKLTT